MTLLHWLCGLRGHNEILQFADQRLSVRCVSCGWESPGWTLDQAPPVLMRPRVIRFRKRLSA